MRFRLCDNAFAAYQNTLTTFNEISRAKLDEKTLTTKFYSKSYILFDIFLEFRSVCYNFAFEENSIV